MPRRTMELNDYIVFLILPAFLYSFLLDVILVYVGITHDGSFHSATVIGAAIALFQFLIR